MMKSGMSENLKCSIRFWKVKYKISDKRLQFHDHECYYYPPTLWHNFNIHNSSFVCSQMFISQFSINNPLTLILMRLPYYWIWNKTVDMEDEKSALWGSVENLKTVNELKSWKFLRIGVLIFLKFMNISWHLIDISIPIWSIESLALP